MTLTRNKIIVFSLINLLVLIVLAVPLYFVYQEYQKTKTTLSETQAISSGDLKVLMTKVGALIELPPETPTVATVSDVEQLKNQQFFIKAQNGDKVLVFKDARKAILYDPVNNRIREVGPVEISDQTPTGTQSSTGGQTAGAQTNSDAANPSILRAITVGLINGTDTQGLTTVAEDTLLAANANTKVTGRAYAQRRDYKETLIIDITGTKQAEASAIGRVLGARITTMPDEERPTLRSLEPQPDIIILLGADFSTKYATPTPTATQ